MPQTGPDLVSAGYPISNALTALLGGTSNGTQSDVPVYSNIYFGLGGISDVAGAASPNGSVNAVAIPVVSGAIVTKLSLVVGASAAASANVTNLWAALYTGTGSAPGTSGAQPSLIASAAPGSAAGSVNVASASLLTFTFATPQTITAVQAPYGYVYAAWSFTTTASAGNGFSLISQSTASVAQYPWFSTSPVGLYLTSNNGTGSAVPANIGTATQTANPPVALLY